MITEVHQQGRFYRLSTGRSAHYENLKPHVPSPEDSEAESIVEENWNDPEQGEVPKWTEPDLPIPAWTRSGNRKRTGMRYNRYGDDFLIDKIQPDDLSKELLSVGELAADDEWQIINDNEHYPQTTRHQNGRQIWNRAR